MKTKLIVEEDSATLIVEAENIFEKEMLAHVEKHENRSVSVSATSYCGMAEDGTIKVKFFTNQCVP